MCSITASQKIMVSVVVNLCSICCVFDVGALNTKCIVTDHCCLNALHVKYERSSANYWRKQCLHFFKWEALRYVFDLVCMYCVSCFPPKCLSGIEQQECVVALFYMHLVPYAVMSVNLHGASALMQYFNIHCVE